jgi:hypothetical protein
MQIRVARAQLKGKTRKNKTIKKRVLLFIDECSLIVKSSRMPEIKNDKKVIDLYIHGPIESRNICVIAPKLNILPAWKNLSYMMDELTPYKTQSSQKIAFGINKIPP